jgi:hypothetical protein
MISITSRNTANTAQEGDECQNVDKSLLGRCLTWEYAGDNVQIVELLPPE